MEEFERCSKSSLVLSVIRPIAKKVTELKGQHGTECSASTILQLLKQCQSLQSAGCLLTERLVESANDRRDVVMEKEVQDLKKRLETVTESFADHTRNLHKSDVPVGDIEDVWENLIDCSEQLLTVITKALVAWDHSRFKVVDTVILQLEKLLTDVTDNYSIQRLPDLFQELVNCTSLLTIKVEMRSSEMCNSDQKEMSQLLMLQLCHTLPLFADTSAEVTRNPLSRHFKAGQELVINHMKNLLIDLRTQLSVGSTDYQLEEPGSFISSVDRALDILSQSDKEKICERIKPVVEEVLRQAMAVACCCEEDRKALVAMCENVLKQLKNMMVTENCGKEFEELEIACDLLADALELLEQSTSMALIRMAVKTFCEPTIPLRKLMDMNNGESKCQTTQIVWDSLIMDFDLHVDRVFQLGGLALACTTGSKTVLTIRDSLATLEWLEGCLVPALSGSFTDPHQHSLRHVELLARHWCLAVERLCESLDKILDVSAFCLVTKQEIHRCWAKLKVQMKSQCDAEINFNSYRIKSLIGRILQLNENSDFLLQTQKEELESIEVELQRSIDSWKSLSTVEEGQLLSKLVKRAQLALTMVTRLADSLNEENQQAEAELMEAQLDLGRKQAPYQVQPARAFVYTSNIEDIPLDLATPIERSSAKASSERLGNSGRKLRRFPNSALKLGDSQSRIDRTARGSSMYKTILNDDTDVGCDISIDITKFLLTRSSNNLQVSSRSSKRHFSWKVQEICLDIDSIIGDATKGSDDVTGITKSDKVPKVTCMTNQVTQHVRKACSPDLEWHCDISVLIDRQKTPSMGDATSQEVSALIEQLTNVVTQINSSKINKDASVAHHCEQRNIWHNFSGPQNEGLDTISSTSSSRLNGIKPHNLSFDPIFPDITPPTHVSFDVGETPVKMLANDERTSVWQDFTAILEQMTPGRSQLFNFSNDFKSFLAPKADNPEKQGAENQNHCDDDIRSMVNCLGPDVQNNVTQIYTKFCSPHPSSSYGTPNDTGTPSSMEFSTPQRLQDLLTVETKLANLEGNIN